MNFHIHAAPYQPTWYLIKSELHVHLYIMTYSYLLIKRIYAGELLYYTHADNSIIRTLNITDNNMCIHLCMHTFAWLKHTTFSWKYVLQWLYLVFLNYTWLYILELVKFKDGRARCYSASLVGTLYMTWRVPRHVFQAHWVETRQNIELMTFAVTCSANIFVGCSVTPTFFWADHFLFWFFLLY